MRDPFDGRSAVVTGGASGIGRALGRALAARGARVVLADVAEGELEATVAGCAGARGRVSGARVDVTDPEAVRRCLEDLAREHGSLDFVFNNAAVSVAAELRDTSLEDWRRLVDVNLMGVVHGAMAAYEIMRAQGHGHIVNVASAAGLGPAVGFGAYGATKHAIVGLTATLRAEAAAFGVRASVVCPGLVDTPALDRGKFVRLDPRFLRETMPVKPYPVDRAAEDILAGVARNRGHVLVTAHARALWMLVRLFPDAGPLLSGPSLRAVRAARRPE